MKKFIYLGLFLLMAGTANSQTIIPPGDYHGADLIMATGQSLTGGHYSNVGRFVIPSGTQIPIVRNSGVVRISANEISIGGVLNGNFAGHSGGLQAPCAAPNNGNNGSGAGGGTGGYYGDTAHGNGGAGGGHGGNGGNSGNAKALPIPSPGGLAYGDITTSSIDMGSGGGSGANYAECQSIGGRGGAGGAGIHLESPNVTITGQVNARGENGFAGIRLTALNIFASGGAGSGGGVLITGAGTITGVIDVNGGIGGNSPNVGFSIGGGGGSGGRIKIFGNFSTAGAVLRANAGPAGTSITGAISQSQPGQAGTITIVNDAPTITTQAMEFSEFCAGAENISVNFTTAGSFGTANIFTAQLSNSAGSFATPLNVGTSATPGLIVATLPASLVTGSGYRVRVVSSDPVIIGSNNGSNITINGLPTATLSGSVSTCLGSPVNITIELTGESPWSGVYTDGTNNIPFTGTTSSLLVSASPPLTTQYALVSVSDANCNGTVSGTAIVTVEDVIAPVPDVAELPVLTAECSLTATPPTATDNCQGVVTGTTEDLISFTTQGTFTINWTFTDDHGNEATQQQTVVIDDTTVPVLTAPMTDVAAQCAVTISTTPTALDNCSGTITATTTDVLTYNEEGTYSIHWNFDDGNGNILETVQTVIIDDTEAPVLESPLTDLTAQCTLTISTPPVAIDNCAGTITATTEDPLLYSGQGTHIIHWKFDDGNGNILEATQTVIIDDTEAPALDLPLTDLTAQCGLTVSATPTATDNCSGTITATTSDPLTYDAQGTYSIAWKFDDGNGNILEATQTVIIDDTEAPVLDAPLAELSEQCGITISTAPTATDNCGSVITGITVDPLTYSEDGTFTIHWKFDDGKGNILEADQTVIIDDTQAPVPAITSLPDITGGCSATVSVVPVATDNCAGELQATTTDPLSYTVPGTYVITWTFDDDNGNTTQQIQNVIIEDDTAPVIPSVVFQISSGSTAGICGRVVEFEDPTPTDNCGVVRFERTDETGLESGDVFPPGITIVSYEAEDAAGHVTTASFSITIVNDTPIVSSVTGPTEAKPVNATITLTAQFVDDNAHTASINWGDGAVTDATLSQVSLTGQHRYSEAGTYSVVIALTDACGEVAEAAYTVVVIDQNAGHVTGAGLFNSPRDAYRNDRHVSCIGAFELNIKYKNGSSVPEGKTEFRLLASNLRFKSTSYEWLTITGNLAIYKGQGELNGEKGYSFLVSAIDAGKLVDNNTHQWNFIVDKFRIKIWNSAGVVIYDNQPGAADNADPTTSVLGVIIIHKGKKKDSAPDLRTVEPLAEEIITETKLSVFPNPFVDVITVQLDPKVEVNPTIQLFDNSGRPLYEKEHTYQETGTYSVNVGDAATKSGVYLLRINQGQRVEVIKVLGGTR
jgi:hypothetical protein